MKDGLRVWIGHNGLTYVYGSMPDIKLSVRCWKMWRYGR